MKCRNSSTGQNRTKRLKTGDDFHQLDFISFDRRMTWMKTFSIAVVDLAVHLTDFFLERVVEGLGKEAALKQSWTQGITSDKLYCSQLCARTNSYAMCGSDLFGNETHTHQVCMEMISNAMYTSLMENYAEFSKHRMTMIIILFVIIAVMLLRALKQLLLICYGILSNLFHWCTTSKEQQALEHSVSIMKLQLELTNLRAYKSCIEGANKDNRVTDPSGNVGNAVRVKAL
jgi:hypothetical protein